MCKVVWVCRVGKFIGGLKKFWKIFLVKGFDFCNYIFICIIFQVTVLLFGEWDFFIRIEFFDVVFEQGKRFEFVKFAGNGDEEEYDFAGDREEQFQKTGRLEE